MKVLALLAMLACASAERSKGPLVPFAPEGITAPRAGKKLALLIGIDRFEDSRFVTLEFAGADARALAASLEGFDDVRVLASDDDTSRASILEAIDQLAARAAPNDTVLIYFSSHGSLGHRPAGELERFLVTRDTRLDLIADTGIAIRALIAAVDRIPARAKVTFLATCHSGAGKSRLSDRVADALRGRKAPLEPLDRVSEATMLFTAAAFGEAAKESRELGHDVYTHFLLQALKHGDADGDGAITASEAHDYARRRTYEFTGGAQRPTAEVTILGEDPIVLAGQRLRAPMPVIYSYAPSAEGLALRIDGQDKGMLPGGIAVEAGGHEIEIVGGEEILWRGRISVAPGDRVEVSRLVPPPPSVVLSFSPSTLIPLRAGSRELVPVSFGAGALAMIDHLLFPGSLIGVELSARGGRGRAPGFGETVPFDFLSLGGTLRLGYGADLLDALAVRAGAEAGVHWFRRRFDTDTFHSVQSTTAFTFGAGADLAWHLTDQLELGLRTAAGAFLLRERTTLHPYLELALRIGVSL